MPEIIHHICIEADNYNPWDPVIVWITGCNKRIRDYDVVRNRQLCLSYHTKKEHKISEVFWIQSENVVLVPIWLKNYTLESSNCEDCDKYLQLLLLAKML